MVLRLVRRVLTHRTPQNPLCHGNMGTLLLLLNNSMHFQGRDKQAGPDSNGQFQVCWVGKDFAILLAVPETPACRASRVFLHFCVVFCF